MSVYIVDYENVQAGSPFCGIEQLCKQDEVYIFYSECAKSISEYYLNALHQSSCKKHFYKLPRPGKNALDFCISMQAGSCLGSSQRPDVAIISHDNGYSALMDFYNNVTQSQTQTLVMANCIAEADYIFKLSPECRKIVLQQMSNKLSFCMPEPDINRSESPPEQSNPPVYPAPAQKRKLRGFHKAVHFFAQVLR